MSWEEMKKNMEKNNGRYIPDNSEKVAPVKNNIPNEFGMSNMLSEIFNRGKTLAIDSTKNAVKSQFSNKGMQVNYRRYYKKFKTKC